MMGDAPASEMLGGHNAIEVVLGRLEGKMDRIGDRMDRYERDHSALRQRIHDLSNDVTQIVMLDLPGRIRVADTDRAKIDARISALEVIEHSGRERQNWQRHFGRWRARLAPGAFWRC